MSDVPSEVIDWCARFAAALGTDPPSIAEIESLLALASVAAHASQRQSAPVACWLAARAGVAPERAHEIAQSL
jgi:Domain of unknown function (DUF6457)